MGEFFHGRRRKIGFLTLVTACVFAAGWVRSRFMDDIVVLNLATTGLNARSNWNSLLVARSILAEGLFRPDSPKLKFRSVPTENDHRRPLPETHWFEGREIAWRIDAFGFHVGRAESVVDNVPSNWAYYCIMPYWSIVIPLTLLSAYLLLSKPRKSTQKKSSEPSTIERT